MLYEVITAVAYLRREQDQDLAAFDVRFDVYFLESSLYAAGRVEEVVRRLTENGFTYRITSYNVCYTKLLRKKLILPAVLPPDLLKERGHGSSQVILVSR